MKIVIWWNGTSCEVAQTVKSASRDRSLMRSSGRYNYKVMASLPCVMLSLNVIFLPPTSTKREGISRHSHIFLLVFMSHGVVLEALGFRRNYVGFCLSHAFLTSSNLTGSCIISPDPFHPQRIGTVHFPGYL